MRKTASSSGYHLKRIFPWTGRGANPAALRVLFLCRVIDASSDSPESGSGFLCFSARFLLCSMGACGRWSTCFVSVALDIWRPLLVIVGSDDTRVELNGLILGLKLGRTCPGPTLMSTLLLLYMLSASFFHSGVVIQGSTDVVPGVVSEFIPAHIIP